MDSDGLLERRRENEVAPFAYAGAAIINRAVFDGAPDGAFSMRGHSVGGFGSVTTNKVIATIGGQVFGKDVQAYPKYGSEKKGQPTTFPPSTYRDPITTSTSSCSRATFSS